MRCLQGPGTACEADLQRRMAGLLPGAGFVNLCSSVKDWIRREVAGESEVSWTTLIQVCVLFNDPVS